MATTEKSIQHEGTQSVEKKPALGGTLFDWIVAVLCTFFISGLFLDGWAHNHGKVDNTFFTPWHAVLYSGFAITAAFLVVSLIRNHSKGYPWHEALPPGYGISLLGVFVFAVGGLCDMVWHILFGIEVSIDALLSPTHLMLALGGTLIVTGPFRAAWLRFQNQRAYNKVWLLPAVLSITMVLSLFTFFTQYAHPLVDTWAAKDIRGSANVPADMYTMNANGSLQTRLISNGANYLNPAWSHDGHKFAFASGQDNNLQIYVANADGTGQTRLTNNNFDEWAPAWSPDDSKIVFTSNRNGDYELYIMNADGSNQTRLTHTSAIKASWSPNGSKIAFVSHLDGNDQIYTMNANGSGQTRLTHTTANELSPSWSPDGSKFVFSSQRDGNSEIFVMNSDGSNQTRLTTNDTWSERPVWSPDGSKIAFVSHSNQHAEVYVMNADGSHQANLSNNPGAENGNGGISWSPDGGKILYTVQGHAFLNNFLTEEVALASFLLQSALLMGLVLLLVRRWFLPFGSLTLIFTLNSALLSVLNDQYAFVLGALVAGLIADLLVWRLKPSATRPVEFRIFAFVVPIIFYSLYFLVLLLTRGTDWSIHLWMGSIILTGAVGLLLSYLLIPPLTAPTETSV